MPWEVGLKVKTEGFFAYAISVPVVNVQVSFQLLHLYFALRREFELIESISKSLEICYGL